MTSATSWNTTCGRAQAHYAGKLRRGKYAWLLMLAQHPPASPPAQPGGYNPRARPLSTSVPGLRSHSLSTCRVCILLDDAIIQVQQALPGGRHNLALQDTCSLD